MGVAGTRRVRERFLMPRLLRDQLLLLREVAADLPTRATTDGRSPAEAR